MISRLKTWKIYIAAAVVTGLDFLTAVLTTSVVSYLTNDDGAIQLMLSGAWSGEPYPFQEYISIFLSAPLAGLYRLFPGVQWWYVWSLAAIAVGIFLIQSFLLRLSLKNRVPLPLLIGILAFLNVGFFIYPIANVSFSIVPAILGTGVVAMLFGEAECPELSSGARAGKDPRWLLPVSLILYLLALFHRRQSGLALLCFILMAFLYYFFSRSGSRKRAAARFAVTAVIFVAATGVLTAVSTTVKSRINGEEFAAFNAARAQFMDYPHDSYEENPELFESVGWDRDTYYLATNWCFLDEEKVNAETLSYLSEHSEYTTEDRMALLKNVRDNKLDRSVLLLYAASAALAFVLLIFRFRKKTLFFFLLNNCGAAVFFLYQVWIGRVLYHSIMVFLIPAAVVNLFLALRCDMRGKGVRTAASAAALVLGLLCVVPMLSTTFSEENREYVEDTITYLHTVEDYMEARPDNFYILQSGTIKPNDPLALTTGVYNYITWGTSFKDSAIYYKLLAANGLSDLNEATLKNDNVCFVAKTDACDPSYRDNGWDVFAMFLRSLKEDCGALGFVEVDRITDEAYVYRFVFEENAADFDTYFDIVDGVVVELPE